MPPRARARTAPAAASSSDDDSSSGSASEIDIDDTGSKKRVQDAHEDEPALKKSRAGEGEIKTEGAGFGFEAEVKTEEGAEVKTEGAGFGVEAEVKTEGVGALNGAPPVRPPPWMAPLEGAPVALGPVESWGSFIDNRYVVDSVTGEKAKLDCPPAMVGPYVHLHGIGRPGQHLDPNSEKNQFFIELLFGANQIPASVKALNPRLADEHRQFVAELEKVQDRIMRLMFDSGDFAGEWCDKKLVGTRNMLERIHAGWPLKESLLDRADMIQLVASGLSLDEKAAEAMIDASGLLAPGGATDAHDKQAREKITDIAMIRDAEKAAFEEKVRAEACAEFAEEKVRPFIAIEDDGAGEKKASIRFSHKAMFQYRNKKNKEKKAEKPARRIVGNSELQEYLDFVGPWGEYTKFDVRYWSPLSAGQSQRRLFEAELEENPVRQIVWPGDMVQMKWVLRAYAPSNKENKCGIKTEPDLRNIFIHHQGKPEETATLLPATGPVGYDYGVAPSEYKLR